MLLIRLERVDGEYVLRIPKSEVVQHDLHEGQILAVVIESLDELGTIGVDATKRQVESWKLNESGEPYNPSRTEA